LQCAPETDLQDSPMKSLLRLSLTVALLAGPAMADIQDPPMRSYTSTRKLGRAWANLLYSSSEIAMSMKRETELDGDSAGATYGFIKGVGRMAVRMGAGVYEFLTFPFPINRRTYRPVLRSNIPWVNGGYEEFPPEFGFQSRKRYVSDSGSY
jgi:putative exosortase-associated protein (TIGR04073 family)